MHEVAIHGPLVAVVVTDIDELFNLSHKILIVNTITWTRKIVQTRFFGVGLICHSLYASLMSGI